MPSSTTTTKTCNVDTRGTVEGDMLNITSGRWLTISTKTRTEPAVDAALYTGGNIALEGPASDVRAITMEVTYSMPTTHLLSTGEINEMAYAANWAAGSSAASWVIKMGDEANLGNGTINGLNRMTARSVTLWFRPQVYTGSLAPAQLSITAKGTGCIGFNAGYPPVATTTTTTPNGATGSPSQTTTIQLSPASQTGLAPATLSPTPAIAARQGNAYQTGVSAARSLVASGAPTPGDACLQQEVASYPQTTPLVDAAYASGCVAGAS